MKIIAIEKLKYGNTFKIYTFQSAKSFVPYSLTFVYQIVNFYELIVSVGHCRKHPDCYLVTNHPFELHQQEDSFSF